MATKASMVKQTLCQSNRRCILPRAQRRKPHQNLGVSMEKSSCDHCPLRTLEPALTAAPLSGLTTAVSRTEHNSAATHLPRPLDHLSRLSSTPAAPASFVPSPTTRLFYSGRPKPLAFPSLDVLPPARLYNADQEPSSSNIPFAKDERISQEHARRDFLRINYGRGTWMPVRPGTAARRL